MDVRLATEADALEVRRLIDGAMLEAGDIEARIEAEDVLVVTLERQTVEGDIREAIGGAIVLEYPDDEQVGSAETDPSEGASTSPARHIRAIAVRRRRRGQGLGTALVEATLERYGTLTANFDADIRPFYEALEFDIERIAGDRYRGQKEQS
ncbi:GNAT family N-acetyltransferase [Halobacteria archaeon AArc-curdl1]|uniref:GNAT family N-acetyltransferase n=1 Tax=Natronosalvus hydrolyticus TaxID=2979988 RepID=A0AAP2Z8T9_9EURY|nr:GNAT family N-acetyltransferase [Halobacteria archaeon AArc-curdl1]